jgi:hypothetical protein
MGGFQGRRAGLAGDACGMVARELPNVNRYGLGIQIEEGILGKWRETRNLEGLELFEKPVEKNASVAAQLSRN